MSEPTPASETQGRDELLAELADDFLRRHRAGERPSVDEYAQKHPELADRIRELFPTVLFMEHSNIGAAMEVSPPAERVGATIGRYRLLERIGEGGFGVVFMAEQQSPVRRKVALKVIKPGIDTRQVIARFDAERQALALMDHPNIARVLDAGATDSGRPYFVMELVHGVPITEFCDQNQLPPHERLELFTQVCRAVQHAHTKGIIHRDIKPTNVLVTLHEGAPVPKVIDFGVAKATGQQLTEMTLFTHFAQMVGTPLYMSPEQAEMTSVDVDTRSDVYSLGVLLYELLTGTTPVTKERINQATFDEVRRIIREEEPPKPSTRLSTTEALPSIAANRGFEPKKLSGLVRGELDWIVMKCLAKERARRYETAVGLARDVERYLHDEPVLAGPPSTAYRLQKYARKYRKALFTVVAFAILLVAATISSIALASWALRERNHAEVQKQSAEANFKRALEAVDQMLTRVGEVQLSHVPQMELVRRDLLEDALRFYKEFLNERGDHPVVQVEAAKAYRRVGRIQELLGQNDEAESAYAHAVALLDKLLIKSPSDPSLLNELVSVHQGLSLLHHANRRWQQAEASLQQATKLLEQSEPRPPTNLQTRENLARNYSNLVMLYRQMGRLEDAETAFLESLKIIDSLLTNDPTNVTYRSLRATCYQNMSLVYGAQGRTTEAVTTCEKALYLNEQLVRDQPEDVEHRRRLSGTYNNLGIHYARHGDYEKAEAAHRQSLALKESIQRDYPNVVMHKVELAGSYSNLAMEIRRRSPEEALEWEARAISILESVLKDNPQYAEARMTLFNGLMGRAYALRRLGRHEDAADDWRRAIEISEDDPHISMRLYRPLVLVFLKEHAQATAGIETLLAEGHDHGPNLTLFAEVYSLGSAAVATDERVPADQREKLADQYGRRAVELLRRARAADHFREPSRLADLNEQKNLDAIRSRPDFQALIAELGNVSTTGPQSDSP